MQNSSSLASRRLNNFFRFKRTWLGLFVFGTLFISSLCSELLANDKPLFLYLSNTNPALKTQLFFPIFYEYSPEDFGQENMFHVDYRELVKTLKTRIAIFSPIPWNPEQQTEDILQAPSTQHFLGTDHLGRDIAARLLYGTRNSLFFGLSVWFASFFFGILIGGAQGYFLGTFDFIVERGKELISIIPLLTSIILITGITSNQSFVMIFSLVFLFSWMGIASQVRTATLSLSQQDFCQAAKAMGCSHARIIFKHILPNAMTPILTLSPFAIEGGISLLATLDYLGFGLPPPTPSIGELLAQGRDNIQNAPWVIISPIVTILFLLISINFIGQALRMAWDPKN
jgi:microcin C transport system permease protein